MARWDFFLVCIFSIGLFQDVAGQEIRVRLLAEAGPRQIALTAAGGDVHLFAGEFEDALATLSSGEGAIVSRASSQLHVKVAEMGIYTRSLRVEPADGAQLDLAVREGSSVPDPRLYPGRLHVSPDEGGWELVLVNELGLETYVASVVSSEYGFDDLEGSKAMAVVARTYALAALREEAQRGSADYDLTDHTLSQVYHGSGTISDMALRAARATEGEVLTYDGSLIQAVYSSSSGGHTADNEDVWEGAPLPYLRGKADPYGTSSPHAQWAARIPRAELLRRLGDEYGTRVEGFVIGEKTPDGRVSTVDLVLAGGRQLEIGANEFRLLIINHFGARSLRSTLFKARREGDEYVFEGSGYGHGVGLSQWGAHDMAERGKSYDEILRFYYTGVQLDSHVQLASGVGPMPPAISIREISTRPEPVNETVDRKTPSRRIGW